MKTQISVVANPIIDSATPAEKLQAAIAGERHLVIVPHASGKIDYIQTNKNAANLLNVIQTKQLQLVRSAVLTGPYYLGLFDAQQRLRVLICRAHAIPNAPTPYRLMIREKEVVSEFIEKVRVVPGTPAVVCTCTTTWTK
jgi:hypothetical protein